jgi:hypothetical protein
MSGQRRCIKRAGLPGPKVQHDLFKSSEPGGRPRVKEDEPGSRPANDGAIGKGWGWPASMLENGENSGPLFKGNVPGD